MSTEWPFVAAVIARLGDAKYNLAAHGIAFSIALIVEAPIINITSAVTALCDNRNAYIKLRNLVFILNTALTLLLVFLVTPPIFYGLVRDLIGVLKLKMQIESDSVSFLFSQLIRLHVHPPPPAKSVSFI